MRFDIVFTTEALEDLRLFRKGERTRIIEAIEEQLSHEPNHETRNRKRLRPNQTAEWVLRVDRFRVFYDIEESAHLVKVEAVWYKRGSRPFIYAKEEHPGEPLLCPNDPP